MKITLALIASLLALVGNLPYLVDIVRRKVEPHPYTWLVWTIVSCVTFFGQYAAGAGVGAIPTAVSEVFTVIIFFFSLQYGFKHITKTDTVFLVIALLGLIPWALTNDPTVSVVVVVLIDIVAFVPTLRKTWLQPKTENSILYASNVVRHTLALFSLEAYNIATTFHSIAMIITNSLMTAIITVRKNKKQC